MATTNPIRFSTKFQDDETDLIYYGYRYYHAGTGRFLSKDPVGERGGVNLYEACGNAHVGYIDFLGTEFFDGGYQKVWSLPGAYGNTRATFEKDIKCVPRVGHILGIFSCCRADLVIKKFLVKTETDVALYHLREKGKDIYPRYSDDFVSRVIAHEALHRENISGWHDQNLTMALDSVKSYSCNKCAQKKAELDSRLQSSWDSYYAGEKNHTNPGWEGFQYMQPDYAPEDEWWHGPAPLPIDRPYED